MTAKTTNFGLEYLTLGEPVRNTRAALQRNAETIDAALTRGGIAPPAAQDLVAVATRTTNLETRATALEQPAGFRATSSVPNVPGSTLFGAGVLTVAGQRGGWKVPTTGTTVDRMQCGTAGLYLITWDVRTAVAGVSWTGARNFAQLALNGASVPVVRADLGAVGEDRGTATFMVALAANDVCQFVAFTSHANTTTMAHTITATRLGAAF